MYKQRERSRQAGSATQSETSACLVTDGENISARVRACVAKSVVRHRLSE